MYRLTFKTNDVMDQIDENDSDAIALVEQYIRYGEYVVLEFDIKAKTVRVVPITEL